MFDMLCTSPYQPPFFKKMGLSDHFACRCCSL